VHDAVVVTVLVITTGNIAFPRVILLGESLSLALGEELFAESKQNNSRRRKKLGEEILRQEFFLALGEVILKKSLSHFQTFFIINMHLYKGYIQI
jgi:hypothetical protein